MNTTVSPSEGNSNKLASRAALPKSATSRPTSNPYKTSTSKRSVQSKKVLRRYFGLSSPRSATGALAGPAKACRKSIVEAGITSAILTLGLLGAKQHGQGV